MTTETQVLERALVVAPELTALEFVVAPADEERLSVWLRCRDLWLAALERRSKGSPNTRRAYEHDWRQFFAFYETWRSARPDGTVELGLKPWQVGGAHVQAWIEQLYANGNSDATVNRKLAAMSSFFNFAMYKFTVNTFDGERALWQQPNPFKMPDRVVVEAYGRAVFPEPDDVRAILRAVAGDQGKSALLRYRNLALLGGLFFTTRRVSEWVGLRWGDLHETDGETPWFAYRYKGGKSKRQAIPSLVWSWIRDYLRADGRWGQLEAGDYVFLASGDSALRFRPGRSGVGGQVPADYDPAAQPISTSRVNDLLKTYGKRAGVPAAQCHPHGLRHAGALARLDDGAELMEIRDTLGHGNIAITQIYVERALAKPRDERGNRLAAEVADQLRLL